VGEKAVVLVVADDEVIKEVASFDKFAGHFFVGSAWVGVAG